MPMTYVLLIVLILFVLICLKHRDMQISPEHEKVVRCKRRDEQDATRVEAVNLCNEASNKQHDWEWWCPDIMGGINQRFCRHCGIRFKERLHADRNGLARTPPECL